MNLSMDIATSKSIAAALRDAARRTPDRTAIVDEATQRRYAFREFVGDVLTYGTLLRATVNLAAGDRVALLADASIDYLHADYGVMAAGLVRVALDPSLSVDEIAAQIADAGAAVLLFGPRQASLAMALRDRHRNLPAYDIAQFSPSGSDVPPSFASDLDVATAEDGAGLDGEPEGTETMLAALNYTGGTTGAPKAVMHTHRSLLSAVAHIGHARAPWSGDVMLNVRPLWPIAAISVLSHLLHNGTVVLGGQFTPESFADLVARHQATCTSLVPTHLVRLVRDLPAPDTRFASLRCIDIGAAAVAYDVLDKAQTLVGPVIATLYGLTEAPWSCYRSPAETALISADAPETHGLVGRPIGGVETGVNSGVNSGVKIRIADADGRDVLPGEEGEVLISGPHLSQGYWHLPELSGESFRDGWFFTGDLGRVDRDGLLYIQGRKKNVIRSGGKSLQPQEVEAVVAQHPSILDVAVIGMPDAEWGERVVAVIVVKPECAVDAVALREYCHTKLSAHKRPKAFYRVPDLPKSHYGKVQLAKLKAMIAGLSPLG